MLGVFPLILDELAVSRILVLVCLEEKVCDLRVEL
jgi:hypothetical protein